jgi:phenylacetic acid degradation operon negative regulatory protein
LAGRVQSRQGAQDWSLEPALARWRGAWRIAVVASGSREVSERAALRDAMRRLHYGSLREGVWTRPDNLPRASGPAESWKVADAQCTWWTGRPDDDPAAQASELFDSAGWSQRAEMLIGPVRDVTRDLRSDTDALAVGFVTGAAALAHVRADPLLPRELVADAAVGDALRTAYRAYEVAFSKALRAWFGHH